MYYLFNFFFIPQNATAACIKMASAGDVILSSAGCVKMSPARGVRLSSAMLYVHVHSYMCIVHCHEEQEDIVFFIM